MTRIAVRIRMVLLGVALVALSLGVAAPPVAGTRVVDVTASQAQDLMRQKAGQKDFVILDVRTPEEFAAGHLAGAVNLNLLAADFAARLGALDRGKTYLVYCRSGNRSTKAVQTMQRLGFQSVYHMRDGVIGWQAKGFSLSTS